MKIAVNGFDMNYQIEGPDHAPSRLILFWSEARACLATLRGVEGLAELTEDDLRRHLRTCLTG